MPRPQLHDIIEKLYDEYGSGLHWEVVEASKTNANKWVVTVVPATIEKEKKGAEHAKQ